MFVDAEGVSLVDIRLGIVDIVIAQEIPGHGLVLAGQKEADDEKDHEQDKAE